MNDDPDDTGERRRMAGLPHLHDQPHPWRMPLRWLLVSAAVFLVGMVAGALVLMGLVWWWTQ